MNNINNFTGITAFLNGESGLHEIDSRVYEQFINHGHITKILDNLFENPAAIKNLRDYSNLVLFTTGLRPSKVEPLVKLFVKSSYVPKNVIFLSENTALEFVSIARTLKDKGTNFWFIDYINCFDLYEINWI